MKISISSKMPSRKLRVTEKKRGCEKELQSRRDVLMKSQSDRVMATKESAVLLAFAWYFRFSRAEKAKFERQSNPRFQSHFFYPNSSCLCELLVRTEGSFLGLDVFAFNAYKEFQAFKSLHLPQTGISTYSHRPKVRQVPKGVLVGGRPCERSPY